MNRLQLLAPVVLGLGFFVTMLIIYTIRVSRKQPLPRPGSANEVFGPFWAGYVVWMLRPLERVLVSARISPTLITSISLGLCVVAGSAIALGYLATGAWLFVTGGILDMVDGRLARATNRQTKAGALFDSVADRWAELALFTGFAWYLRDSAWVLAVMAAAGGSFMVSYTRARAETLGVMLRGGAMQRAERIVAIALGTLIAAALGSGAETVDLVAPALGITLALVGGLSAVTAVGRWIAAHRVLVAADLMSMPASVPTVLTPAMSSAPARARTRRTGADRAIVVGEVGPS